MGLDVKVVFMDEMRAGTMNVNSWDAEDACAAPERIRDFWGSTAKPVSWEDLRVEPGHELIELISGDRFMAVWVDNLHVLCTNLGKHARKNWKQKIVKLVQHTP